MLDSNDLIHVVYLPPVLVCDLLRRRCFTAAKLDRWILSVRKMGAYLCLLRNSHERPLKVTYDESADGADASSADFPLLHDWTHNSDIIVASRLLLSHTATIARRLSRICRALYVATIVFLFMIVQGHVTAFWELTPEVTIVASGHSDTTPPDHLATFAG